MPQIDENGYVVPTVQLSPETLVFDRQRQRQVMRIHGIVPLPIGAEIELVDPNVSARVVNVRLTAGTPTISAALCIDVSVPAAYWGEGLSDEESEAAIRALQDFRG